MTESNDTLNNSMLNNQEGVWKGTRSSAFKVPNFPQTRNFINHPHGATLLAPMPTRPAGPDPAAKCTVLTGHGTQGMGKSLLRD